MGIRNYGLITSVEELYEFTDRLTEAESIGFDIETGYHGEDKDKFAIHPETAHIVGISFTSSTDWARYIPLSHDEGENLPAGVVAAWLWHVLNFGTGVAHNAGFELRHLAKFFREHLWDDPDLGHEVQHTNGYFPIKSCTQIEAYLAAEHERFGLKFLTNAMFGHQMTELIDLFPGLAKNKQKTLRFNTLPLTPQVVEYACEDSAWCLAIHEHYHAEVSAMPLYQVEMAVAREVLPPMEDYGVRYDWQFMRRGADALLAFRDRYNAEIMRDLSEMLGETVAFNIASSPQLSNILYAKLGYRTNVFTEKTKELPMSERRMSTGKIALERLAKKYPVVEKIRLWRQMTRLVGTYLSKYEDMYQYADDGHTHPSHLAAFVVTGRFAVSDPPYQQSPKIYHFDLDEAKPFHEAHRATHGKPDGKKWCGCDDPEFAPPPGTCFMFNFRDSVIAPPDHYILGFDLSQAELRAIAGEAQETALLKAFAEGQDVHALTAALMLGVPVDEVTDKQRDIGKTMNFALLYGMGVKSLADRLALEVPEAQRLYDSYFAVYSNIARWSAQQVRLGRELGRVTSRFGRRLPIWEFKSEKDWVQQKGERQCVNYPIQGSATGDYMKIAMVNATRAIKRAGLADKVRLVMNVHDALEFYVHRSVQPPDIVRVLSPAVIFPVEGWPTMAADWHIAKKWGSPTKVEVKDDGTLIVKGDTTYELTPTIEVDEETGELIELLPDVDREDIEPFILADPSSRNSDTKAETAQLVPEMPQRVETRTVHLVLSDMPEPKPWSDFLALMNHYRGPNTLIVDTPQGEIEPVGHGVAMTPDDATAVGLALRMPVQIRWATDDVNHAELVQGMTF